SGSSRTAPTSGGAPATSRTPFHPGTRGERRAGGDDEASQVPALHGAELRRSIGRRPRAETGRALSSVGPLPTPDGAPIDPEAVRHHMNGDLTLQQLNRTPPSPLELRRAPLWAHRVPPTVEHSVLGHYLHSNH